MELRETRQKVELRTRAIREALFTKVHKSALQGSVSVSGRTVKHVQRTWLTPKLPAPTNS